MEVRIENLKSQNKELESNMIKQISGLEKEKAVSTEKLQNLETKLRENEQKYSEEQSNLSKQLQTVRDQLTTERKSLQAEVDTLKKNNSQIDQELHEVTSLYEREKALWEGKVTFLE